MKNFMLVLCALLFAAPFAGARGSGRGFSGRSSGGRGFSGARASGFSRPLTRPSFGTAARPSASRSVGRATFHAAALSKTPTTRRISADTGTSTPAYAVPGAKIISAGQQPVYSDPGNGGTHSVEGGGFIAIDQSKANDVGRGPGITWARPDSTMSSGSGGGGSGGSSNGPAFNPAF